MAEAALLSQLCCVWTCDSLWSKPSCRLNRDEEALKVQRCGAGPKTDPKLATPVCEARRAAERFPVKIGLAVISCQGNHMRNRHAASQKTSEGTADFRKLFAESVLISTITKNVNKIFQISC